MVSAALTGTIGSSKNPALMLVDWTTARKSNSQSAFCSGQKQRPGREGLKRVGRRPWRGTPNGQDYWISFLSRISLVRIV